jgi:hypothetical protein
VSWAFLQWAAGIVLTVSLATFGFILKLTADIASLKADRTTANEQMHDVAEMIGELWRARNQ